MLVGNGCDISNIDQAESRVAGAFNPYELRLIWPDELCNVYFDAWGERNLNAVCCCDFCEIAMRPSVDIRNGNDVGALSE